MGQALSPALLRLIEALAQQAYAQEVAGGALMTADQEFEARENFVYRYFDRAGQLLYVGVTNAPENRHRGHARKPWYRQIARKTLTPYSCRSAALAAERHAIATERPLHNGTPRTAR